MVDQNFEGEVYYLEFEDEHGNKQYFTEDVILSHEGQEYAVLVHVQDEDADHEGQDDTYMILAARTKTPTLRNLLPAYARRTICTWWCRTPRRIKTI